MEENEIFDKIVAIVTPLAKDKEALSNVKRESDFLKDLQVSSARLVDIILAIEDQFDVEVDDSEADKVETVGAAVDLIKAKLA